MSEKGIALWNNVLSTTLRIPHVAVDRTDFLKKRVGCLCQRRKTCANTIFATLEFSE